VKGEPVFRRVRTVTEADTDQFYHVNNVVWLQFVIELADAHSRAEGLDPDTYRRIGGLWIVRRHEIDYHAPAAAGENILEETWVSEFRGARSVRRSRFSLQTDGRPLVNAVTHWAYVNARTLKPRRIDSEVLGRFPVHTDPAA
jgi:acyl-CoA thioester hydrolase